LVLEGLLWGRQTILRSAKRGFTLEEQKRRYEWSRDEDLQYWSGSIPSARSFTEFQRSLPEKDWPADGRRRSFAILTYDGELIGMVSGYAIDWKHRSAELGVYIGQRNLWSHGLGTDAIVTLLRHVFCDLGLKSVFLNTYESNVRALRSYEKVGFRNIGARRRFRPRVGYYREVRMVVDAEEFISLHGSETVAPGPLRELPSSQRQVANS
jgi:[ribosomal protein S5]-alanine N-acetyltransferase